MYSPSETSQTHRNGDENLGIFYILAFESIGDAQKMKMIAFRRNRKIDGDGAGQIGTVNFEGHVPCRNYVTVGY